MGSFLPSFGFEYILVTVDYVSKWVEAKITQTNDHKVVIKFLKSHIFSRFGCPRAIISDEGTHFLNRPFEALMRQYFITHKVATLYHPQMSGQIEVPNWELRVSLKRLYDQTKRIGYYGWKMHCGHTVLPTKLPLACPRTGLCLVKHVIYRSS